jgi:type IX secretion system PorP/SprF family membrane protein
MKKIILTLFGCLFLVTSQAQQDPQYNLYQFNQMVINPAYAGARDAIAVILDVRKQWVSFPGAPTTLGFSVHAPVLNNKVGIGLSAVSDQIGAKSVTGAYGNFAYIAKLNNKCKLSFGLRAGYLNYKFNFSKVNYKDANETTLTDLSNTNKGVMDIDAGLFLKTNTFFVGLSATHLTQAKIYTQNYESTNASTGITSNFTSSYALNSHLFFVMGKAFAVNENFVFSPSVMVKSVAGTAMADVNLNFLLKKRLWLGAFFKQGYGAGALIQVYATDKLRIGYSYDTGIGSKRLLGASHEVMLGFDFGNYKSKTLSPRFL